MEATLTGAAFEDGQAKVSVPFDKEVPEGKVVKVYCVDGEGNTTDMNAAFENGLVTFSTNNLSTYAITFEDKPAVPDVLYGDANGDGKVNLPYLVHIIC